MRDVGLARSDAVPALVVYRRIDHNASCFRAILRHRGETAAMLSLAKSRQNAYVPANNVRTWFPA